VQKANRNHDPSLSELAATPDAMDMVDSAIARAERKLTHLPDSPVERRLRAALALYRRTADAWRASNPTAKQILALRYAIAEVIYEADEEMPTVREPGPR
jgi:hypothetical protein